MAVRLKNGITREQTAEVNSSADFAINPSSNKKVHSLYKSTMRCEG